MCPTEITAFSDRYEEFKALNTEVLGVSIDSQFSHLAWIQTGVLAGAWGLAGDGGMGGRAGGSGVGKGWLAVPWAVHASRLLLRGRSPSPCATPLPLCLPADRKSGGVGDLKYPLVADLKKEIRWALRWR